MDLFSIIATWSKGALVSHTSFSGCCSSWSKKICPHEASTAAQNCWWKHIWRWASNCFKISLVIDHYLPLLLCHMYNYKICSFLKLDWRSVVKREKFADAVIICTPDCLHKVTIYYVICILIVCTFIISFSNNFFFSRNLQWLSQRWATTFCWRNPWQWVLCEVHNFNLIMSVY